MKKVYLIAFVFMFSGFASYGQGKSQIKKKHLAENGTPRMVEFHTAADPLPLNKAKEVLKNQLELEEEEEMRLTEQGQDPFGFQHQKYQQYYKGIKVEFGIYRVHAKNGAIESVNGDFKKVDKDKSGKKLKTKPSLSESEALQKATGHIGAQTYMWQSEQNQSMAKAFSNGKKETFYPEGELVILSAREKPVRDKDQEMVLAYKFDIYAQEPLSRDYVYVNAHTGEIELINPIIKHAIANGSGDTRYSGSRTFTTDSYNGSYRLRDFSRGSGIETYDMNQGTNYGSAVDFTDNNNSWTAAEHNNTAKDNAALDAHWGAQMTYDYWKSAHNRNSFDNNGAAIKSYVHYDKAYDNAFWNGSVMTYGDGSDTYFDALTSLDVAAHEIGHAICTYTADLVYQNESGAMNEGFSDIWAATVEHYAAPGKQIWLIGEDIERRAGHAALRSMSDPNSEDQPDTYKGNLWYSGTGDNGGVHTNSGVLNHWFYLLSVGKTGTNDIGNAYSVSGISIEKAAKIAYRLESVYLSSGSVYADARTYSIKAAEDIYGAGSNEVIQTTNAWHAVGIGSKYGEIAYCDSKGNNAGYEWIAEVKVGAFTNTSASAGYTDFTSKTVELAAGSSYALSLKPGFSGTSYNEYWKVWIDYNKDGDFDDSGELVYNAGTLSKTTRTGTISVPATASGTTRMRVSMKYNGAQTSCETFSYGEVEDYTVNIGGGGTVTCGVPASLSASNVGANAATLNWGAVSNATSYKVQYRVTGSSTWTATTSSSTSVSVTGLAAASKYEFQVAGVCSGGTSAFSASATFTTASASLTYCASNGKSTSDEWIDYVSFGGMERTSSADGGYYNGTSQTANATAGTSPKIYFSAGFAGTSYSEYWKVWIDFNQDGDFSDSGEQVVSGSSSSSGTLSATVNIPSSAKTGKTRMRVSMKYKSAQGPCESFSYGEVEDYSVNIGTSVASAGMQAVMNDEALGNQLSKFMPQAEIFPNPAGSTLNIATKEKNGFTVEVFDISGKALKARESGQSHLKLNIADLKQGVYLIKIKGERETTTLKFIKK